MNQPRNPNRDTPNWLWLALVAALTAIGAAYEYRYELFAWAISPAADWAFWLLAGLFGLTCLVVVAVVLWPMDDAPADRQTECCADADAPPKDKARIETFLAAIAVVGPVVVGLAQ